MKRLITLIAFFSVGMTMAQTNHSAVEEYHKNEQSKVPSYVRFNDSNELQIDALKEYIAQFLSPSDQFELKLMREEIDQIGYNHQVYKQYYNQIPIEFSELRVHLKGNLIESMNGTLVDKAPSAREISLTESTALQNALDYIGAQQYKWQIPEEEEFIKKTMGESATFYPMGELTYVAKKAAIDSKKLRLAYKFNIYAQEPLSRTEIYVDAANGEILFTNELIHTGNANGTAKTAYSGVQNITTDSVNKTKFRLQQTTSGGGVNTYNLQNTNSLANAIDFTDSNNYWNNVNSSLDQYAADAHWGAEQTYQFYKSKFNRNSINNNGFPLNSYVHFSTNYANALWDGQRMIYGDGDSLYTPLTALDITGHEITHGLTSYTANLVYQAESGAMNESFSDIFGAAIEKYAKPSSANWTLGEDIGVTLRSMSNPKIYGDPDTRNGTNWKQVVGCIPIQQNDQCGVHTNSGVQNYWFYLLAHGKSGTNDLNHTYTVQGLGMDTAAAIVFRSLTVYLGRTSDYDDARFYSIRSAMDLYGPCSAAAKSVTNAWYAVGVGNSYVAGVHSNFVSVDTASCQPSYMVSFVNNSSNSLTYKWDFGDGITSTLRKPTHTYTSYGKFDVTLMVDGGSCGADTLVKQNYVSIDSANPCILVLQDGLNPIQTECSGKIFDTGGSNGLYSANEDAVITIQPKKAVSVTLIFPKIDIENGSSSNKCDYDFLEVFDGPSTKSPSLGRFCNNNLPLAAITSTRNVVTIKFHSDPGLEKDGFEIIWGCNAATQKPQADFLVDVDSTCTGLVNFTDFSKEGPSTWKWYFGDGQTSTLQSPVHQYTVDGTYDVKLITTNAFGTDSIFKNNIVYVKRPASPTVFNDTVCIGGNAILKATGAQKTKWYTHEFGGISILTDTAFALNGLLADTSFWVENYNEKPTKKLGSTYNTIGNGNNYSGDQYLIFDVYKTIILTDVYVYGGSSGTRTFELRDKNGKVLQTKTHYVGSSLLNISLDFQIEPGTDYQLGIAGGSSSASIPDLYRNNSGVKYPYSVASLVSITGSSAGSSYYYFFYNWRVKELDCISARNEIFGHVDTTCSATSLAENELDASFNLYPNPTKDEVSIVINNSQKIKGLKVFNSQGKLMRQIGLNSSNFSKGKYRLKTTNLPQGVYYVSLQLEDAVVSKQLIIIK